MHSSKSPIRVRQTLDQWLRAFNARDIDTLMSLYDPEIVYANSDSPLMRGVEQVRPWFANVFSGPPLYVLFLEETLFVGQELAVVAGKFLFRTPDPNGQMTDLESGRVSLVFRLSEEGQWLFLYDTDNRPPDCTASDFADLDVPSEDER